MTVPPPLSQPQPQPRRRRPPPPPPLPPHPCPPGRFPPLPSSSPTPNPNPNPNPSRADPTPSFHPACLPSTPAHRCRPPPRAGQAACRSAIATASSSAQRQMSQGRSYHPTAIPPLLAGMATQLQAHLLLQDPLLFSSLLFSSLLQELHKEPLLFSPCSKRRFSPSPRLTDACSLGAKERKGRRSCCSISISISICSGQDGMDAHRARCGCTTVMGIQSSGDSRPPTIRLSSHMFSVDFFFYELRPGSWQGREEHGRLGHIDFIRWCPMGHRVVCAGDSSSTPTPPSMPLRWPRFFFNSGIVGLDSGRKSG